MSGDKSESKSYSKNREMKLFPSSLDNHSSVLFMKRFLFIIVSNIIKKRLLVPTSVFRDVVIDGLNCCIVSEDTDLGKKLSALLYAVTEAIEMHYLRDFFILISTEEADDVDEVIEVYTLTFTYADGARLLLRSPSHEIVLSCETVSELRKEVTSLLLRLDILMNILSPVPQNAFPYFKLIYYEDTPNNYEPTGFKSSSTNYRFKKLSFISKISAGTFSTKFDGCSVYLESTFLGRTNEQHEQNFSTAKNELQMLKKIIDETPTFRLEKNKVTRWKKMKHEGKTKEEKSKKITEFNRSDSVHLRISSPAAQIKTTTNSSQENSDGIIESMRASLLEEDSSNESDEVEKSVSSYVDSVANTTHFEKSNFSTECSRDSEEIPESSGQFATFGSISGPCINSPYTDSTFSLPTVTELVDRGLIIKKDLSIGSLSSNTTINVESDTAKKLFMRRNSNVEAVSNTKSKAKKMKISRSKIIIR